MTIPVSRTIVRNVFLVCITSRGNRTEAFEDWARKGRRISWNR